MPRQKQPLFLEFLGMSSPLRQLFPFSLSLLGKLDPPLRAQATRAQVFEPPADECIGS